jgi:hypothetical protein
MIVGKHLPTWAASFYAWPIDIVIYVFSQDSTNMYQYVNGTDIGNGVCFTTMVWIVISL